MTAIIGMMLTEMTAFYDFVKAFVVIMSIGIITTSIITYIIMYFVLTIRDRKYNKMMNELDSINTKINKIDILYKQIRDVHNN